MTQSVMECSEALANMTTTTDDDANTNTVGRRLLQDIETTEIDSEDDTDGSEDTGESGDSEDSSESAGISSDDSGEFDEGNARFVLSGQAFDQCDVETNGVSETMINSKLVYQTGATQSVATPE